MLQLSINEVKTHLSATLAKVEDGETVIICKPKKSIARIIPIEPIQTKKRPIGLIIK